MDIERIKENYHNAVDKVEQEIKEVLEQFGADGIDLPTHDVDEWYSVVEELEPNHFVKVKKVRVVDDELQIMVEGEKEWSEILHITDWLYFLDEVMTAIYGA